MQVVNTITTDLVALNPGSSPVVVEALGRNSVADGGGGTFLWQPNSTAVPNGGTIFASSAVSGARWLRMYDQRLVHVAWFGAYGRWDGVAAGAANDSEGIQAAINAAQGKTVAFAATTYRIASSLILRTATNLRGSGALDGGTILMADLAAAPGPGMLGEPADPYRPDLAAPPLVYNAGAVQWLSIEDLVIDGHNQNVYGLYLYRNYYLTVRNVRISRCNLRPYVNVLGQLVHHDKLVIYDNAAGAVTYASTSMAFDSCGFEGNAGDYYLQVRQPASGFSKGGTTLTACWFEVSSTRSPTLGYLALSGRSVCGSTLFFTNSIENRNGIAFLSAGGSLMASDAGHSMPTGPAAGARVCGVNFTGGIPLRTYFGVGSSGCEVQGFVSAPHVLDESVAPPAVSSNQVRVVGSGIDHEYVLNRLQVRDSAVDLIPGISVQPDSNFFIDVQEGQTRFYGPNNYVRLNSGILEFAANASLRVQCGTATNSNIGFSNRDGVSSFATGHIVLGAHHIWVDLQGRLRMKNGTPTGDNEGVVIGSQS